LESFSAKNNLNNNNNNNLNIKNDFLVLITFNNLNVQAIYFDEGYFFLIIRDIKSVKGVKGVRGVYFDMG